MRAKIRRVLWRLLFLLPVLFLLVGCAAESGAAQGSSADSAAAVTETARAKDSSQRAAKSKKKQKKRKKSEKQQTAESSGESGQRRAEATARAEKSQTKRETTAIAAAQSETSDRETGGIREDGSYTSRDEVALYLHTYQKLPQNFISKRDAEEQGFRFGEDDFGESFPGKSVGGSRFGNYDGLLPDKAGRRYYECDIDYTGGRRNAKRLVYSNDGLIFYTEDHYKTFVQLY